MRLLSGILNLCPSVNNVRCSLLSSCVHKRWSSAFAVLFSNLKRQSFNISEFELHHHASRGIQLTNFSRQVKTKTHRHYYSTINNKIQKQSYLTQLKSNVFASDLRWMSQSAEQNRKRILTVATYVSCAIGAVLMTFVIAGQYRKLRRRARGADRISEPLLGRRQYMYKYRGFIYSEYVADNIDRIQRFNVREDDVWIMSYPKAGTTWMEEIVYLIVHGLDLDKARSRNIEERIPYFEHFYPGFDLIDAMDSPRIIKSHLPMSFIPNQIKDKKPKVIYIARNPKDTVVSFYYFIKMLTTVNYNGNLNDFVEGFVEDKFYYSPWSKHVLQAWQKRSEENILFIKYEDMKKDNYSVVKQVASFLGKPLSDDEIKQIVQYTQFENMRKNPASNYSWMKGWAMKEDQEFFRKGVVGDWKNQLNQEQIQKIDEMVEKKLQGSSLVFEDHI